MRFIISKSTLTNALNIVSKAVLLAAIRVLVFLLCGILLRHWFLVIFAGIFAAGHFAVTFKKYKEN